MPINRLYHTWFHRIRQMRPGERKTRVRNLAWLIAGIFLSRSVHLRLIARKIPGRVLLSSITQRLRRLLNNSAIRVREWYDPVARHLLAAQAQSGQGIRLIVDGSKVGFGHQLLMVAIAYRRRAIPIVWTWVRSTKGHSSGHKQLALLNYVRDRIPAHATVSVVGDSEFGTVFVLRQLDRWQWSYVLRQKGRYLVQVGQHSWQRFDALIEKQGQSFWFPQSRLTECHGYSVNLLAHWEPGEKEPWLLATNLPSRRAAWVAYRRRMWIEEMFGDLKGHGFDLESTHLRYFLRLSRLTLAVVLLYVWLVAFGSQVIKRGHRSLVDRSDRRDLSIFRIGFDTIERRLANSLMFSIRLTPYF